MKRFLLLLGVGGLAALPALSASCSLTSTQCLSGLSGSSRMPVPVSANFTSITQNQIDTLTLTGITFNNNVVKGGTVSLTTNGSYVDAVLKNVAFASGTTTVTVGMTFSYAGADTLFPGLKTNITEGTLDGSARLSKSLNQISISEVVTLDPTGSLFSLTNMFEIQHHAPGTGTVMNRAGAVLYDAYGIPLFNPNEFNPNVATTPEPISIALVGLGLMGGALAFRRHRRKDKPAAE